MSARRTTRVFAAAATVATLVLIAAIPASNAALEIRHSSGARYEAELTRAYKQCSAPNDTSSDGIPACSPPVTSGCDYSRGQIELRKVKNEPKVQVDVSLTGISGVISPPGSCLNGPYTLYFTLRVSADDPSCAGDQCTWIEGAQVGMPLQPRAGGHIFELDKAVFEDELLANYGITAGHVANYEIQGVTVYGPDNKPLASAGIGDHGANSFRDDVTTRYPVCTAPDTATTGGVPACSGPVWGAHCDFATGEIQLRSGGGTPIVRGRFGSLVGASPSCADGTYTIETVVRATGDVCNGSPCTLVDTTAVTTMAAVDGVIAADGWDPALAGPFDSVEFLDSFIRDPLGEPLASVGFSNAFLLGDPVVRIGFRDPANTTDDRLTLKAAFPHPPIDPTVYDATFTVTDQNGTVYSVSIPGSSWEVLKPGAKWQYKDPLGSIGGVRKATIKEYKVGGAPVGFKLKLKAKSVDLSAADLPSVNVVFSAANTTGGLSIGERNLPCKVRPKGLNCRL